MTVNVEFTPEELRLLTSLVADQMFRREFIDPKMPGYRANSAELQLGKALVVRLRSIAGGAHNGAHAPKAFGRSAARGAALESKAGGNAV